MICSSSKSFSEFAAPSFYCDVRGITTYQNICPDSFMCLLFMKPIYMCCRYLSHHAFFKLLKLVLVMCESFRSTPSKKLVTFAAHARQRPCNSAPSAENRIRTHLLSPALKTVVNHSLWYDLRLILFLLRAFAINSPPGYVRKQLDNCAWRGELRLQLSVKQHYHSPPIAAPAVSVTRELQLTRLSLPRKNPEHVQQPRAFVPEGQFVSSTNNATCIFSKTIRKVHNLKFITCLRNTTLHLVSSMMAVYVRANMYYATCYK